eukprot:TRINITY_DN12431_c0_g1_i1.p1 TRINITY_DN12431_c0_g1~~TRINITY_DN12431_c0_g1_i1.p1  ORF type:complete len:712 (+),score=177.08 TRINITY_DN12431_c0_g1_i1:93-2138(+)
MSGTRMKPYFSSTVNKSWEAFVETGKKRVALRNFGKPAAYNANGLPSTSNAPPVMASYHRNTGSRVGAMITGYWIPENAKKKNMRPKKESWNTTQQAAIRDQGSKRLAHIAIPNKIGANDDVMFSRYTAEMLHGLEHTPLLDQQWDPERNETNKFAKKDPSGRTIPAPPLPDFPRFYDRELFSELDTHQARRNEVNYNEHTECFMYFHFWAHDDKWIYRRRVDVWDYVKKIAQEHVREKLATVQKQLYGVAMGEGHVEAFKATGGRQHIVTSLAHARVSNRSSGFCDVSMPVRVRFADPLKGPINTGTLQWKTADDITWSGLPVTKDGLVMVTTRMLETEVDKAQVYLRMEGADDEPIALPFRRPANRLPNPPIDLLKALPGYSHEEAAEIYRQELQVLEEELVNTLYNIDGIMHPTPIMYACQNELAMMGINERIGARQGRKDFDWWFHHQSFCLYLPFYDEQMIHDINNWRYVLNQKIGNSPWIDSLRQHSPQPVNCLIQTFKKHNNVWDERVFKVENEPDVQFQEEHMQEWSFAEHAKEPQPTQLPHLRQSHPKPISMESGVQILSEQATRDEIWAQMPSQIHKVKHEGQAEDFAEEYFRDTFAARRAANLPVHPEDQPGLEVDEVAEIEAVPEAERPKYIRRLGKLYRKYYHPYNPMPQRFVPMDKQVNDEIAKGWF